MMNPRDFAVVIEVIVGFVLMLFGSDARNETATSIGAGMLIALLVTWLIYHVNFI